MDLSQLYESDVEAEEALREIDVSYAAQASRAELATTSALTAPAIAAAPPAAPALAATVSGPVAPPSGPPMASHGGALSAVGASASLSFTPFPAPVVLQAGASSVVAAPSVHTPVATASATQSSGVGAPGPLPPARRLVCRKAQPASPVSSAVGASASPGVEPPFGPLAVSASQRACLKRQAPSPGESVPPPVAAAVPAQPSGVGDPSLPAKRRRLRGKTQDPTAPVPLVAGPSSRASAVAVGDVPPEIVEALGLEPENPLAKGTAYLVTFPHPDKPGLVAPETLTRKQMVEKVLDSCAHPVYANAGNQARGRPVEMDKLTHGREPNSEAGTDGKVHSHDHTALLSKGDHGFRFLPIKRALLNRHGLASHWSRHFGYHSAVRYLVIPSAKKPWTSLDPSPECWAADGNHPPLFDAAQEPSTVQALRARREHKVKVASEEGKAEPRATELDLYTLIVENGFRNTADDNNADSRLIAHVRQYASPQLFKLAWGMRHKLNSLINDVWSWEEVDDTLARVSGTRVERLVAASELPCLCGGQWPHWAALALQLNGIDAGRFWYTLHMALHDGRREDKIVPTLVGRRGGEGKSFLLKSPP